MLSFVFPWGVNHAAWLSSSPCPDYNRCPAGCSAHSWGTDDMRRWELHHGSSLPPNAREQKLSNSVITQLEGIYLLTEKNPKQKKTRNKIPKQFQISKKHSNNIQLDFINHNPQSKKKKITGQGIFESSVRAIAAKVSQFIIWKWKVFF